MLLSPSWGRRWLTHTPTFPPVTVFPSFSSVISSSALFALNCEHAASSWSLCVFLYNQCLLLLLFVLLLLRLLLHLLTRSMPSHKQRDCCCICWSDQDFFNTVCYIVSFDYLWIQSLQEWTAGYSDSSTREASSQACVSVLMWNPYTSCWHWQMALVSPTRLQASSDITDCKCGGDKTSPQSRLIHHARNGGGCFYAEDRIPFTFLYYCFLALSPFCIVLLFLH